MRSPLRRLILIATLVVAIIAVGGTAIAALSLIPTADAADAEAALAAQIDRLAAASPAARDALVEGLSGVSDAGALVAEIPATGAVIGSAAAVVPARVIADVRAGLSVSTEVRRDGVSYLVEGRPTGSGAGVVAAQDVRSARSLGTRVLWPLVAALAIGFAAAALVAVVAARRLSRPLTRVATAARALAAGDREVRLVASGVAEVAEVETALETLAAALSRSERRQREFLLSISHEMRTPLTAIRGYAEALADGLVSPDRSHEIGDVLRTETARLTAFTSDLLALARLEADDFPIHPSSIDIAEIAADAARAWRATADAAQVTVELDVAPTRAYADGHRLRQIIDGLLENALRVSPPQTTITLRTRQHGPSEVLVEVADGGPGLTEDDAAHAFDRGLLRERYRDVRAVGSGLGLSIAARLVQRMGGQIVACPREPNGTSFAVTLPVPVAGPSAPPLV